MVTGVTLTEEKNTDQVSKNETEDCSAPLWRGLSPQPFLLSLTAKQLGGVREAYLVPGPTDGTQRQARAGPEQAGQCHAPSQGLALYQ